MKKKKNTKKIENIIKLLDIEIQKETNDIWNELLKLFLEEDE